MDSIQTVLMNRDGLDEQEANSLVKEAEKKFFKFMKEGNIVEAYNICEDFFGLEPDYLDQLILSE